MAKSVRRDEQDMAWMVEAIATLSGGHNAELPPNLIEDEQTPDSENVTFRYGKVRVDTGYKALGVFKNARTASSAAGGAGNVVVEGSANNPQGLGRGRAWGYHAGDVVKIQLDSGEYHVTTIASIDYDYDVLGTYDVIYLDDNLPSASGYGSLVLKGNQLRGTPQQPFEHESAAGATELVLVTQSSFYKYVPAVDEWQYVSCGVSTTLSANENGDSDVMNVADTTDFNVDDYIGITMDAVNGKVVQHMAQITAVGAGAPGTLTIDTPLYGPSGSVVASSGNAVIKALALDGDDDNQVVFVGVPSHEWTAFTNNKDYPYKYDGSTVEVVPNLPSGGNILCRTMGLHGEGFLVLGGLVEGGTEAPYKVIWCDAGDPTNWSTGLAGSKELLDSRDAIIGMKSLAGDLIIYRTRSPVVMRYLGTASYTFEWIPRASGESSTTQGFGPVSPNAVFALADRHVILDRAGVLVYRGGLSVEDISSEIYDPVFSDSGLMDGDKLARAFIYHSDRPGELFCCYADGQHDFPNRAAVLDFRNGTWRLRKFYHEVAGAGLRSDSTGVRIIDLEGTISEQNWIIGGGAAHGRLGTMILAGVDGDMYEYDYVSSRDNFQAIAWHVATKILEYGDRGFRLGWVEAEYEGTYDATLYISKDRKAFQVLRTLDAATSRTAYRIRKQSVQRTTQYKIAGESGPAEVGAIRYGYREESRWGI